MIPYQQRPPKRKSFLRLLLVIFLLFFLGFLIYKLPPVHGRLAWRVEALRARIKYAFSPPEDIILQVSTQEAEPSATLPYIIVTSTATAAATSIQSTVTLTTTLSLASTPSPTITPTTTPLPPSVKLSGFTHMYQSWNNCGPANLAMALSYWGWEGDQRDTAAYTKPNPRDKNIMPYEMADFVTEETDFSVIVRVGGDLETLKAFIAAGFPVIVEKSFEGARFEGWMGHYQVVNGYDDQSETFIVQDSYDGPDLSVSYEDMRNQWRSFNYTYIVVYPPEKENRVFAILGPHVDRNYNNQYALDKAIQETKSLEGRDQFFAWFNRGTNLVRQHNYLDAATAYDAAFANYSSIPNEQRPWRILWYQTGPYFAYYYTQRYENVIELATTTLEAMSEPILEESYYWRARAKMALGDNEGAIEDLLLSLKYHPGFQPSLDQLEILGVEP